MEDLWDGIKDRHGLGIMSLVSLKISGGITTRLATGSDRNDVYKG